MITAEERPPCRSGREGPCPSGWPRAIEVNSERCSVRLPARERFRSPQRNSRLALGQRTLQPAFVTFARRFRPVADRAQPRHLTIIFASQE